MLNILKIIAKTSFYLVLSSLGLGGANAPLHPLGYATDQIRLSILVEFVFLLKFYPNFVRIWQFLG